MGAKKCKIRAANNATRTITTMTTSTTKKRSPVVQAARNHLRRHGWTQADAARELGVSTVHLCYVLTDRRISHRLLRDIHALPENPNPA